MTQEADRLSYCLFGRLYSKNLFENRKFVYVFEAKIMEMQGFSNKNHIFVIKKHIPMVKNMYTYRFLDVFGKISSRAFRIIKNFLKIRQGCRERTISNSRPRGFSGILNFQCAQERHLL